MSQPKSEKANKGILEHSKKLELLYALVGCKGLQKLLKAMWDSMPEELRRGIPNTHKSRADAVRKYDRSAGGTDPRNGRVGLEYLTLVESTLRRCGLNHDHLQDIFVDSSYAELSALVPRGALHPQDLKRLVNRDHCEKGVLSMKAAPSLRPPSMQEMWERGHVDQVLVYYTEEAAQNWREVALHPSYGQYRQCSEALEQLLATQQWSDFCRTKKPDGIVSLGAGSASKDILIIESLHKHRNSQLTLSLVDYSQSMLEDTATVILKELGERGLQHTIELEPLRQDFMELRPLSSIRRRGTPVIFFIAGGTIGNVNEAELLRAVARSSEAGDWFVVGLEFIPDEIKTPEGRIRFERDLQKKYDQPYARRLLAPALERIWKLLGHSKQFEDAVNENIVPRLVYGRKNGYSMVPQSMSVVFEITGGTKPVVLMASTRYDEKAFLEFAAEYGFRLVIAKASKENPRYRMLAFEYVPNAANSTISVTELPVSE